MHVSIGVLSVGLWLLVDAIQNCWLVRYQMCCPACPSPDKARHVQWRARLHLSPVSIPCAHPGNSLLRRQQIKASAPLLFPSTCSLFLLPRTTIEDIPKLIIQSLVSEHFPPICRPLAFVGVCVSGGSYCKPKINYLFVDAINPPLPLSCQCHSLQTTLRTDTPHSQDHLLNISPSWYTTLPPSSNLQALIVQSSPASPPQDVCTPPEHWHQGH